MAMGSTKKSFIMSMLFLTGSICVVIHVPNPNVTTLKGNRTILTSEIRTTCPDSPQITWYKGKPGIGQRVLSVNTAGKVLVNSNYTNRVQFKKPASLVIISPDLSDTGNYSCEALITIDIPPIAVGFVYLNVVEKGKAPSQVNLVCLGLAVVGTITVVYATLVPFLLWRREASHELFRKFGVYYVHLFWFGLCLVGTTILWLHHTVSVDSVHHSVQTTGATLVITGLLLCLGCSIYLICWHRRLGVILGERQEESEVESESAIQETLMTPCVELLESSGNAEQETLTRESGDDAVSHSEQTRM